MIFADLLFIFVFIPAFALLYLLAGWIDRFVNRQNKTVGGNRCVWRNGVLMAFSLLFYAWGEPVYVFLMLICVIFNYWVGYFVAFSRWPRVSLWIGLLFNLVILVVFKYSGLWYNTLHIWGIEHDVRYIGLPIGLSFYIFQSITYLADVYRKEVPVQTRFFDLLLYISLFPQLIAGPIVRYSTIALQLYNRNVTSDDLSEGIYRFIVGLGKKVILADTFAIIASQLLIEEGSRMNFWAAWIGMIAFALQIYFDFSGYSDMAIGLSRSMGFRLFENFNHPYCCASVTDFWRRWHISLGGFFRDYVYIPMGGSRRRQPFNLLTVWLLTGLWHGASWNFAAWGLYYGMLVAIEKIALSRSVRDKGNLFTRFYSLVMIIAGWAFFFYTDFKDIGNFFSAAVGMSGMEFTYLHLSSVLDYFWIWIIGILLCMPASSILTSVLRRHTSINIAGVYALALCRVIVSVGILFLCISFLMQATAIPFLYTRF